MTTDHHRRIACAILLDTQGRLLLQRRDDIPGILQPGKIGLFGGHREGSETFLNCVMREVQEETGLSLQPEDFVGGSRWSGSRGPVPHSSR
jgi:8-oxo-dGTP diphosphatase